MKVDVVGHEPSAFKSGASLFTPGKATVLNLLFEVRVRARVFVRVCAASAANRATSNVAVFITHSHTGLPPPPPPQPAHPTHPPTPHQCRRPPQFTYKLNNASTWEAYTQHVWEPLWLAGYRCWALGLSTEASKPNFAAMRERLRAQCADAPTCGLNVYCTLQDFEIGEQAMQ